MEYHIIGGGPVGFAVALLLAKNGLKCIVYEGREKIVNDIEESYPIGINPRALATLEEIDPALATRARNTGELVDSWQIFAGPRRVVLLPSGCVYGTTRGGMNFFLYETALKNKLIEIKFGHKLVEMDFKNEHLIFETQSGDKQLKVKAGRVIGADGVNSRVRREMIENFPDFKSTNTRWTNEFRVLFGAKNHLIAPDVDTKVHYIFSGCYSCVVSNGEDRRWTVVVGVRDDASEEERKLLLSNDASAENVKGLRRVLQKRAPLMVPFFPDDEELTKFFSRRTFTGSIVKCNRMNQGEWVCLVGDAAHSIYPATGEGFNSGLEDALVLHNIMKKNPERPFSKMNELRLLDVHAIGDYAMYVNEIPSWGGEKVARTGFLALRGIAKKLGILSVGIDDYLFGPLSLQRVPYREVVHKWKQQKLVLINISRCICYPLYIIFIILLWIFRLFRSIFLANSEKNK